MRAKAGCLVAFVGAICLVMGFGAGVGFGALRWSPDEAQAMPAWTLPFAAGETWRATGPHTDGGEEGQPLNALDFAPLSQGKVRAIAAGEVEKVTCEKGFYLAIDHGSGWRSTYYHMINQQEGLVGTRVAAGTYLGDPGTELPCGGKAGSPHVHIAIYHRGRPVPVDGMLFGGHRPFTSGRDYDGFWIDAEGLRVLSTDYELECCLRLDSAPAGGGGS